MQKVKHEGENPKGSYLCWNNDVDTRRSSSSGGAFSAIASYVLRQKGKVWGAAYEKGLKLTYQCVESESEMQKLRGSKYIQCEVGDAFLKIKEQLKEGTMLLFCGTPCHVRGLLSSIPVRLQEKLLTVDFVCHGVPSPQFFVEYIAWLSKKHGATLKKFNFREEKYCMNYSLTTGCTFDNGKHMYLAGVDNAYIRAFENGCTLRDCCYNCKSNGKARPSDFTLADAFGGEKMVGLDDLVKGVSALIINSDKGVALLDRLDITKMDIPLENIVRANGNYTGNVKLNIYEKQKYFYADADMTFDERVVKWMMPSKGEKIKLLLFNMLGAKFFYWIKNRQ